MAVLTKLCNACEETHPITSFHKRTSAADGLQPHCKQCKREYQRSRCTWEGSIKHTYGITAAEWLALSEQQDHVCMICKQTETALFRGTIKRLATDHCHTTGKVRGLLCQKCNTGLGNFNDDTQLMLNAINYLNNTQD